MKKINTSVVLFVYKRPKHTLKIIEQLNKLDTKKIEPLTSIVDKTLEPRIDKISLLPPHQPKKFAILG